MPECPSQEIYENFTFGPRYPAMDPSRLEALSTVNEITGYLNVQVRYLATLKVLARENGTPDHFILNVQAHHAAFRTLDAFRNLKTIGGRQLTEYFSSLYVVKTSLTSLNLRSLRKIRSGSVAILENKELCFTSEVRIEA